VRLRHDYYNDQGGRCPDFAVVPTPDCAQLMTSLGMVFRDQGHGFTILIDEARVPALLAYVAARFRAQAPGAGCWTRLSFLLVPRNPLFVGITDLPITTDPDADNLYVSNLQARPVRGQMLLGGAGGVGGEALYPVTGSSLTVPTPAGRIAILTDLSGAPVAAPTAADGAATRFTLTGLPWGRYGIGFANPAGQAARPPRGSPAAQAFLFLPGKPRSLCLVDLLLAQPAAGIGNPAAYPIAPPVEQRRRAATPAPLSPVDLILPFRSRGTYWRYYVVSQGRGPFADTLRIAGKGTSFAKSAATLPNGDPAILFTSSTALPLQQRSPFRFSLSGHRHGANGSLDPISIAALPAASPAPVWPAASGDVRAGASEIYVYV
jgi:hypothetical protein